MNLRQYDKQRNGNRVMTMKIKRRTLNIALVFAAFICAATLAAILIEGGTL